jgi:DNA-binding transcriptional ArsR family regulator
MSFANRALGRRRGHLRSRSELPPLVSGVERIEALSLPVRLAMLEHVRLHGPATATECGVALDMSAAAASYHLRVLAEYGFVAEVADESDHRKRRWKATAPALTVDPTAGESTAEVQALDRLEAALFERAADLFARYLERRQEFPDSWRRAATSVQDTIILTPAELSNFRGDLMKLLARYRKRRATPTGDATGVFIAFNAVPRDPPVGKRSRNSTPRQTIPLDEEVVTP